MSTSVVTHRSTAAYPNNRKRHGSADRNGAVRKYLKPRDAVAGKGMRRRTAVGMSSTSYTDLLISGYMVKLPPNIRPYAPQRTMIVKILTSLTRKLNALVESPTGSGKTLGLLSACCAWLERYKAERAQSRDECKACKCGLNEAPDGDEGGTLGGASDVTDLNASKADVNTSTAYLSSNVQSHPTLEDEFDSDFRTATSSSFTSRKSEFASHHDDSQIPKNEAEERKHTCLKRVAIYYGTRTHKQISQVIKEFSRLPYGREGHIKHTVLGSREHLCINPLARSSGDISGKCKELIASDGIGCSYKNSMRVKYEKPNAVRRLIAQTAEEVNYIWDIEDLVEVMKCSTPPLCPYFSTRNLIDDADIIFCPFSYLIDPIIRENTGLSLKNAVVILDEAHNVEDVCREAVSFSFTERELVGAAADFYKKSAELEKEIAKIDTKIVAEEGLIEAENMTGSYRECLEQKRRHFRTVINFLNKVLDWFISVSSTALQIAPMKNDRLAHTYGWEKLFTTFMDNELDKFCSTGRGTPFSALLEALSALTDNSGDFQTSLEYKPGGAAVICVEKFLYFFKSYSRNNNRTVYKLFTCIDKPFVPHSRSDFEATEDASTHTGVLDMNSYDKEKEMWLDSRTRLKGYREVKYGYRVAVSFWCMLPSASFVDAFDECRSVILASGTLSPTDTFRTELGTAFQQQMEGSQIIPAEQIFAAVVPAGPSGQKLCGTYRIINQDDRFIREISVVLEHISKVVPKGVLCFFSSYRVMDQVYEFMEMSGILRQIQNMKLVLKEPRRASLMGSVMEQYENAIANPKGFGTRCTGALMMAVFRGKVSEGIDFADDRARCVVTVGIPFPNAMDEYIVEKKKYNDENCKKLQILSGDEWYTMQAYRALNQALGRCLRHRLDWGSILMLDERLLQTGANPNAKKVSQWIRQQLRPLASYDHFLTELTNFVNEMKEKDAELHGDSKILLNQ